MSPEKTSDDTVHVAIFPSAGPGHLIPNLRLAALLYNHHCKVTIITAQPTVSLAETNLLSRFHSSFPNVTILPFHLLPLDPSSVNSDDPFFLRFESLRRSSHLLTSIITSLSPPLSSFISDIPLISAVLPVTETLHLPTYIFQPSSCIMFSLVASLQTFIDKISQLDIVEIPGVVSVPKSSIPPPLLLQNHVFANILKEDGPKFPRATGILFNSFDAIEPVTLRALRTGKVAKNLPPAFPVGPLMPAGDFEKSDDKREQNNSPSPMKWLDQQSPGSVVYICFGSRTSTAREQIKEIGNGLLKTRFKFLWALKDKKVDREDQDGLDEVVGVELMGKLKSKGLIVKDWVDQFEILSHESVGGFVSHCGWNSVLESGWHGKPMLLWPQIGDQRMNAEAVDKSGWVRWKKEWGWPGEFVVSGEEFGEAVNEMMNDEGMRVKAAEMKAEARRAVAAGGTTETSIRGLIDEWKRKKVEMKH